MPGACERWSTGCGSCPELAAPPAIKRDASRLNWQRKRWIFARSRISVVSPSRWMLDRVQRSLMAPAIVEARVIPNGVDLTTPPRRPTGAAHRGNPSARVRRERWERKPAQGLQDPAGGSSKAHGPGRTDLGRRPVRLKDLGGGIRIRHEPYQPPERLAAIYRSAEAYVHASAEEFFCLTASEDLACGAPRARSFRRRVG